MSETLPKNEVDFFKQAWGDGYLASDIAEKLTCIEVEALAGLLQVLGDDESAKTWISYHAEGDDCGDSHCLCDECNERTEA
ncbi:hypothetical protein FREDWARD_85 [Mycobacterium phage Fredward]|uniref:hypothetical protein n=1 Tax=Mycobacterium phage Fredward TaxID=1354510 RepID=UPI0003BA0066|nr:hypothetical protein V424_gp028 [Mycobacterium phage Fredward]AGY37027.1 hypothetical protein FREDWARD_85 [Mycobacterium phage Fredward]